MVVCKNKDIVTALREIAGGMVSPDPKTVTKTLIPNLAEPPEVELELEQPDNSED